MPMSMTSDQEILNISETVRFEDEITKREYHSYQPYAGTKFNNNDEIRILLQAQDIYTLISDSFLQIEGKFASPADAASKLSNNAFAHLFSEIRFELNNVVIDKVRDAGITSTLKGLATFSRADSRALEGAGWKVGGDGSSVKHTDGTFSVIVPLKMLLGFAEMYRKVMINCKQELILHRAHSDENAFHGKDGQFTLTNIEWHVPHVHVNDSVKLKLLRTLRSDRPIKLAFRQWDLHELTALKENSAEKWAIRTTNQLEKPRYIIVAFQTDRKNKKEKNASEFDAANIRNLKVFLNSEAYPYNKQEMDFASGRYAIAYQAYSIFQQSYYDRATADPLLTYSDFKKCPVFVVDCSRQSEEVKSGAVDVQLELEAVNKFPKDTVAYALIIHDVIFEYNPLTGLVHKLV